MFTSLATVSVGAHGLASRDGAESSTTSSETMSMVAFLNVSNVKRLASPAEHVIAHGIGQRRDF